MPLVGSPSSHGAVLCPSAFSAKYGGYAGVSVPMVSLPGVSTGSVAAAPASGEAGGAPRAAGAGGAGGGSGRGGGGRGGRGRTRRRGRGRCCGGGRIRAPARTCRRNDRDQAEGQG